MAIDAYSLCPGGTGKKIKFLRRRLSAGTAKNRPHDRRRAVLGLLAAHRSPLGTRVGSRSALPAGHEVHVAADHRSARDCRHRRRRFRGETPGKSDCPSRDGDSRGREQCPRGVGSAAKGDTRRQRRTRWTYLSGDGACGRKPAARGLSPGRHRLAATAMRHHRQGRSRGAIARGA